MKKNFCLLICSPIIKSDWSSASLSHLFLQQYDFFIEMETKIATWRIFPHRKLVRVVSMVVFTPLQLLQIIHTHVSTFINQRDFTYWGQDMKTCCNENGSSIQTQWTFGLVNCIDRWFMMTFEASNLNMFHQPLWSSNHVPRKETLTRLPTLPIVICYYK